MQCEVQLACEKNLKLAKKGASVCEERDRGADKWVMPE